MNKELEYYAALLDVAEACCKRAIQDGLDHGKDWYVTNGNRIIKVIDELRANAIAYGIPPPHGATLGLSRDLSEWAPDYLYKAGSDIDDFYLTRCMSDKTS